MDAYQCRRQGRRGNACRPLRRGALVQPVGARGLSTRVLHGRPCGRDCRRFRLGLLSIGPASTGRPPREDMTTLDRRRSTLAALADDVDAILVTALVNVRYLTG